MTKESNLSIRKGTEQGVEWGYGEPEWDNRGLDETWINVFNQDRSDYRTIVIGIADAIDIIENAFENALEEESDELLRVQEMCDDLREYLKGNYIYS